MVKEVYIWSKAQFPRTDEWHNKETAPMLAEFWGKTSLWKEVAFAFWLHRSTLSLTSQVPQPLLWYNIRYSWGTLSLNMDQLLPRLPVWGSTGMLIISRSPNLNSQNSYHHHLSQRKKEKLTIRKNHLRNHFWPIESGFSAIAMYGICLLYFSIYLVGWSLVIGDDAQKRGA